MNSDKDIVQRYQFEVSFVSQDEAPLDELKPLEAHILAVDLGTEMLKGFEFEHRTNTLIIWVEDDWRNETMRAIRQYVDSGNAPFTVIIRVASGTAVKEVYAFKHAQLNALQHSIFTREVQDERLEIYRQKRGDEAELLSGVIKPPTCRQSSAKLLQISFATFESHIIDSTVRPQ